ncbi:MAG: hypothetical protein C0501_04565 [Isosphaera sp.]|nr:hypothetical protein [Isosphaera sp.]
MRTLLTLGCLVAAPCAPAADEPRFRSCPPARPLPEPSKTPLDKNGRGLFVDAAKGDDAGKGTEAAPWKTVRHAAPQLRPGDTLYLRGGTYHERLSLATVGEKDKPVTIRSYPGELAVIDGGYPEFARKPEDAWEPVPGSAGEYRSTKTYPDLAEDTGVAPPHENHPEHPRLRLGPAPKPDPALGVARGIYGSGYFSCAVKVLGNFADSMVPLHGYYHRPDLPADDPQVKRRAPEYHGPGVWFDMKTHRIHARLEHTNFAHLGDRNYRGETDPRKLALVIGGPRVAVHVEGAKHLRLQDLVVRGTRSRTLNIERSSDVELDHVTLYGGAPALQIQSVSGLRVRHSALRGQTAPWSSRSSEKYHGISSYLFIADGTAPANRDVEIANCELTDNHDGPVIGTIDGLRFHHNLFDNFNDDGLYLTTDMPAGRDVQIYQNYLSRSLSMLAFSGDGKGQAGKEALIYRNVFDLRQGIHAPDGFVPARTCGDHGSPVWKPMRLYHNTVLLPETPWRNYYGGGLAKSVRGTSRSYLNNVFYHAKGVPGFAIEPEGEQLADGNLHWSPEVVEKEPGEFLKRGRTPVRKQPDWFAESKKTYPPGWTAHDLFADPRFVSVTDTGLDVALKPGSPAVDAGVPVPREWPDPLREQDAGKPDVGAIPAGVKAWSVGIDGRFTASGVPVKPR